jgi:hypothetical protein
MPLRDGAVELRRIIDKAEDVTLEPPRATVFPEPGDRN